MMPTPVDVSRLASEVAFAASNCRLTVAAISLKCADSRTSEWL